MDATRFWVWVLDAGEWKPRQEFSVLESAHAFATRLASSCDVAIDADGEWIRVARGGGDAVQSGRGRPVLAAETEV